jgi:hypothetical protein
LQPAQAGSFTLEQPEVEAVEDAGAGENHRRQAARDIEGGVVETEKLVEKSNAAEQGGITLARPGQARKRPLAVSRANRASAARAKR